MRFPASVTGAHRGRPRILFVGAFEPSGADGTVGGVTYACRTLLRSAQAERFEWTLIDSTARTNKARTLRERALAAAGRLVSFTRALVGERPDKALIFCAHGASFWEKGLMALIASARSVPVVFAPTSGFLQGELESRSAQARFARRVFARCESIVCQSAFWRDFYREYTPDEASLRVVQNWLDVDAYPVGTSGQKHTPVTVLFMAWLVREKGIFELLKAVDALMGARPTLAGTFRVVVCGDGDDREAAEHFAAERDLPNVEFRGWTGGADKADLLLSSHVFVTPSHAEGLSNSLLEAMASGLAVISTDVGAAVDVVDDGENGFLVGVGDVATLAERLGELLDSPSLRDRLGARARRDVERENDVSVGVPRFMALLETPTRLGA